MLDANRPQAWSPWALSMAKNVNAKGRKIHGRFAMLPIDVLNSDAVSTLSHAFFRVLTLLAGAYNGRNNGALGITGEQAKAHGIGSRWTLYRALKELTRRGLIEKTYPASRVPPRPTMYAVTWKPVDDTEYTQARRLAANDWKGYSDGN